MLTLIVSCGVLFVNTVLSVQPPIHRKINNLSPYVDPPVPGKLDAQFPVIFEPLKHIILSRSTYKVITFLDLEPIKDYMDKYERYLELLTHSVYEASHETRIRHLETVFEANHEETPRVHSPQLTFREFVGEVNQTPEDPIPWEKDGKGDLGRNPCPAVHKCRKIPPPQSRHQCIRQKILLCMYRRQFDRIRSLIEQVWSNFKHMKAKFLGIMVQLDKEWQTEYHDEGPSGVAPLSRVEREVLEAAGTLATSMFREENYNRTRSKQSVVALLVAGITAVATWSSIRGIKEKINQLQEQNIIQEKKIGVLGKFLNLTMERVRVHDEKLYRIEVQLVQLQDGITQLATIQSYTIGMNNIIQNFQFSLTQTTIGLLGLKADLNEMLEYLRTMGHHRVNPVVIPLEQLRFLLNKVKEEMKSNPRLELPYDPTMGLMRYYEVMRIVPVLVNYTLVIELTIPISDTSLQLNLFQVHSLPIYDPEHGVQTRYQLEGTYFAVERTGMYVALPKITDVSLCLATELGVCTLNQALYPVKNLKWCIYALFVQNREHVDRYCKLDISRATQDTAMYLGGYQWAVAALQPVMMQLRCVQQTSAVDICLPLQIITVPDGCEGYSVSFWIPAKNDIASTVHLPGRDVYFLKFNYAFQPPDELLGPWVYHPFELMPFEEAAEGIERLIELPPLPWEILNKKLPYFKLYKIGPSPLFLIGITALVLGIIVAIFMVILWCKTRKEKKVFEMLKGLHKGKPDLTKIKPLIGVIMGRTVESTPESGPSQETGVKLPNKIKSGHKRRSNLPLPMAPPKPMGQRPVEGRNEESSIVIYQPPYGPPPPIPSARTNIDDVLTQDQKRRYLSYVKRKARENESDTSYSSDVFREPT